MPTVFISHSSKTDPYAAAVRQRVQQRLSQRGWDVRVDVDGLKGGEEWSGVLYQWLADCDAAVILVGREAMVSKWVIREAGLLLWRRALGSRVTIVPALLGDLTRAEVEDSDLADLLFLEFVKQETRIEADEQADLLADRIVDRLPNLQGLGHETSDEMKEWLGNVAAALRDVTDEAPLRAAVRALDLTDEATFATPHEGRRYLAHQLLAPGIAQSVHVAATAIAWHVSGSLRQLVTLLTPTWVECEAARRLLPQNAQVVAMLNAVRPETATHYMQRAACCSANYRSQTVVFIAGEGQGAEFALDCERAARKLLDVDPDSDLVEGEMPLDRQVGFLIVDPRGTPLDRVVEALQPVLARFGWLNAIVLTGESEIDPVLLAPWGAASVMLSPRLAAGQERMAARVVHRLRALCDQVSG
jgi:hypothetical protein